MAANWITYLPFDLCLEIVSLLSIRDIFRLQRVSRNSHALLTADEFCIRLLRLRYPKNRETRLTQSLSNEALAATNWARVLLQVAIRHETLLGYRADSGTFSVTGPILEPYKDPSRLMPIRPRDEVSEDEVLEGPEAHEDDMFHTLMPLRHPEPMWTYSAEDSLLVYPADDEGLKLAAEDLETGHLMIVPFDFDGKILRRLRLRHRLLIIEWCPIPGSGPPTGAEFTAPHFATAIDVIPKNKYENERLPLKNGEEHSPWEFVFRAEWRLSAKDLTSSTKFFSAHNNTHYILYIWKDGQELIDDLFIWHLEHAPQRVSEAEKMWKIWRKDHTEATVPSMVEIGIDEDTRDAETKSACGHFFVHQTIRIPDDRLFDGIRNKPYIVTSTGFPLSGAGPLKQDTCDGTSDRECDACGGPRRTAFFVAACFRHNHLDPVATAAVFDRAAGIAFHATRDSESAFADHHSSEHIYDLGEVYILQDDEQPPYSVLGHGWYHLLDRGYFEGDARRLVGQAEYKAGPTIVDFTVTNPSDFPIDEDEE